VSPIIGGVAPEPLPESLPSELSKEQALLLSEVADSYLEHGSWPIWQFITRRLDRRHKLDAREIINSLPRAGHQGTMGWSYGFTSGRDWRHIADQDQVPLTIAAGLVLPDFRARTSEHFVRVINYMSELYDAAEPSPHEVVPVWLASDELASAVPGLTPEFIALLPAFLENEPLTRRGGSEPGWRKEITENLSEYRDVSTLEDYVTRTASFVGQSANKEQATPYWSARMARPNWQFPSPDDMPTAEGSEQDIESVPDHGRVILVPKDGPVEPERDKEVERGPYIGLQLLKELEEAGAKTKWSLDKLLDLAAELNSNISDGHFYTCLALVRAICDHIPPAFGKKTWLDLLSSYSWTRPQDKKYAEALNWYRDPAHDVLHRPMGETPSRIALEDVPPRACLNAVLQELLVALRAAATDDSGKKK
jgi:hypothetical protein